MFSYLYSGAWLVDRNNVWLEKTNEKDDAVTFQ